MRFLGFARESTANDERRIRESLFEPRSSLPTSAVCLVASGVRETLTTLLGTAVRVRVCEPALPEPEAWLQIARDAMIFRVRGRSGDAAIVLRPNDAAALIGAAFGELRSVAHGLSAIEQRVLERAVGAIGSHLGAVCGAREEAICPESVADLRGFTTYFEMHVRHLAEFRIGVALSKEPASEPRGALEIDDLGHVEIELAVSAGSLSITTGELLGLQCGEFVPMNRTMGAPDGRLDLAGWPLAYGECGVRGARYAIALGDRQPC